MNGTRLDETERHIAHAKARILDNARFSENDPHGSQEPRRFTHRTTLEGIGASID
jgi:hypothetical protein